MRRDKTNDIPFAWYWEGRPLRADQIRPVYTGAYPSSPYQCRPAEPVTPSYPPGDGRSHHRSPKTKEYPEPQHQEPDCCSGAREVEPCYCSLCNDASQADVQYSPAPEHAAAAAASCATSSSAVSSIHYHSHAYFCCYPDAYDYQLNTQSSFPCSASCFPPSPGYYYPPAIPPGRCQCSTCLLSSSSQTPPDIHYKPPPPMADTYHGHHRHPHAEARRAREKPREDNSATMSSGYTDSMYSDCSREADAEKESCQCCGPAWRYYDHPAYREKRH